MLLNYASWVCLTEFRAFTKLRITTIQFNRKPNNIYMAERSGVFLLCKLFTFIHQYFKQCNIICFVLFSTVIYIELETLRSFSQSGTTDFF